MLGTCALKPLQQGQKSNTPEDNQDETILPPQCLLLLSEVGKKGPELIDILKQRQREEKEQAQTLLIVKSLPVFPGFCMLWDGRLMGGKRGGHAASLPLQLSQSLAGAVTCCGLAKHLHIFGFTIQSRAFSAHCYIFFFFPTAASV